MDLGRGRGSKGGSRGCVWEVLFKGKGRGKIEKTLQDIRVKKNKSREPRDGPPHSGLGGGREGTRNTVTFIRPKRTFQIVDNI